MPHQTPQEKFDQEMHVWAIGFFVLVLIIGAIWNLIETESTGLTYDERARIQRDVEYEREMEEYKRKRQAWDNARIKLHEESR